MSVKTMQTFDVRSPSGYLETVAMMSFLTPRVFTIFAVLTQTTAPPWINNNAVAGF